jgi:hypothetical protein
MHLGRLEQNRNIGKEDSKGSEASKPRKSPTRIVIPGRLCRPG